jgi:uncharacterized heparinase superfamily protein
LKDAVGLYLRTLRHLRPSQVLYRPVLRASRWCVANGVPTLFGAGSRRRLPPDPCWPQSFGPIDGAAPPAPAPEGNRFLLLGEERDLGSPHEWAQDGASQLWQFHLHYFEWAWAIEDPDQFATLWRSWRENQRLGHGDAWSPYVASLRAWTFCGIHRHLVAGTDIEKPFLDDLAAYTRYLRLLLERDVGGNHLLKNLKALIGLGVFMQDHRSVRVATRLLQRQLRVQVLADGGHYERSPSYHCQVLGDLIDIEALLASAEHPPVEGLTTAIDRMRGWLGAMLHPDGDVPLFNDCVLVGTERIALLRPHRRPPGRLTVLQPSGYVVIRPDDRIHLVADVGPPCPDDLPAHAHADCLSFELSVEHARVIVDTGTSSYAPGPRRQFERSTAAHNTVEIDGVDQTEVWGTFRAAHRAMPTLESTLEVDDRIEVTASHDGYERLPGRPRHRRTWRVSPDRVEIDDEVTGTGRHTVVARLHAHEGVAVATEPPATETQAVVACDFGRTAPARVVESTSTSQLPLRLTATITT